MIARIPLDDAKRVYDLGCGPGNSTKAVIDRWPEAAITGVDASPDMLAKAKTSGVEADWEQADICDWTPQDKPDLILSNAALHWVDDHHTLFPRLMSELSPKGILAVQMPRNFTSASHTILQQVVEGGPWERQLKHLRNFNPVDRPEDYYGYLSPHADYIDIWETEYVHPLTGEDPVFHWLEGTALAPYLSALEPKLAEAFVHECKTRLARAYHKREDGTTLFPFRRLFMIAMSKA